MSERSSKEQLKARMRNIDAVLREIFSKDKESVVVNGASRAELEKLAEQNSDVLRKLETGEFAVAVVGMEKAGKSTLNNALMENTLLPDYTTRCTFTTTEIMAGTNDEAEITFFTAAEFNEKLRNMLKEVGYVNGPTDINTANLESYKDYWSTIESGHEDDPIKENIYRKNNGSTNMDIRRILSGKDIIKEYLNSEPMRFEGKENLESDDFRVFVQGYRSDNPTKELPHPYAVKHIKIYSTSLPENLILYDVPGFDSTTRIHKDQTKYWMKKADAIILVTNVGDKPNINETQIDMMPSVRDEDGIRLCDKMFVFGNKIDMADSVQKAQDNLNVLRAEVTQKNSFTKENRVIGGSAKAYLLSKGLLSKDDKERGTSPIDKKLQEWKLVDGIDGAPVRCSQYR